MEACALTILWICRACVLTSFGLFVNRKLHIGKLQGAPQSYMECDLRYRQHLINYRKKLNRLFSITTKTTSLAFPIVDILLHSMQKVLTHVSCQYGIRKISDDYINQSVHKNDKPKYYLLLSFVPLCQGWPNRCLRGMYCCLVL